MKDIICMYLMETAKAFDSRKNVPNMLYLEKGLLRT